MWQTNNNMKFGAVLHSMASVLITYFLYVFILISLCITINCESSHRYYMIFIISSITRI